MEISAVKLRESYQIYFVDTNNIFIKQNSMCVVETEHGIDLGKVVKCSKYQNNPNIEVKGKLLRIATDEDMNKLPEIEELEKKAFDLCKQKSKAKNLDMKLVSVKCLFDRTKIIFYFVSDNRVDFRELVRELASAFRTRIEMRQIGVRDEARLVGGFGQCGIELCCIHQREEFEPVSIKMAKEQNLNLNSLKISGMCGRLLCCLSYEYEIYRDANESLPKIGTEIVSDGKIFLVDALEPLKGEMRIKFGERVISVTRDDLETKNDKFHLKKDALERIKREAEHAAEEEE